MYREPIVNGRNVGLKSTICSRIQLEQNEETKIHKNEERLRDLRDNFKCSNIWIIGVPEGEEEEQEMENLFEKIMKGNRLPGSLGSSRVPKKLGPTRNTPRHIIIKLSKIKEERILKAARGESYLQRSAYRMSKYQLISQKKPWRQEKAGKYLKSWRARTYIQDDSIQESYHLEWKGR